MPEAWLKRLFRVERPVIGMVHLPPIPGSPGSRGTLEDVAGRALEDARRLVSGGVDALLVENHGDAPFRKERVEPHVVAALTAIVLRLRREADLPVGVNVLRNDVLAALGVAFAAGGSFVRVNVLVGVTATDQGLVEGRADEVLRYRMAIGSSARILADVDVKFGTPLYAPPLRVLAEGTVRRGGADGLVVSGTATGAPVDREALRTVKSGSAGAPVFIGSGATPESLDGILPLADGLIVGTAFKHDGDVGAPVDAARVRRFMARVRTFRTGSSKKIRNSRS